MGLGKAPRGHSSASLSYPPRGSAPGENVLELPLLKLPLREVFIQCFHLFSSIKTTPIPPTQQPERPWQDHPNAQELRASKRRSGHSVWLRLDRCCVTQGRRESWEGPPTGAARTEGYIPRLLKNP